MNISGIGGDYLLQEMASMRLQASGISGRGAGSVPATAGKAGEDFNAENLTQLVSIATIPV